MMTRLSPFLKRKAIIRLYQTYLQKRDDADKQQTVWQEAMHTLAHDPLILSSDLLQSLIQQAKTSRLPSNLSLTSIDNAIFSHLSNILASSIPLDSGQLSVVRDLLDQPSRLQLIFIRIRAASQLITINSAFHLNSHFSVDLRLHVI